MHDELHPVEGPWQGQLTIAPRPRGGDWLDTEILAWRGSGIDGVVSLLESQEAEELGLREEAEICATNGIDFLSYPIQDRGIPASFQATLRLIGDLDARLSRSENILIHCRQGVGRAGIIAVGLLIYRGLDPQAAIQQVSRDRGIPVPETREQSAWLGSLSSSMISTRLVG